MGFDQAVSQLLLYGTMAVGAVVASLWLGITLWAFRDMKARSRDMLAVIAATVMVAVLNIFGLVLYLMLRPRETLAEAYERSLEEEALLQGIEEKPACPGCGRPTNAHWQVCPYCHTRIKKPCVQCHQLLDLSWNLCPFCATLQPTPAGHPAAEGQPRVQSRSRRPEGRRSTQSTPSAQSAESVPQHSLEFVDDEDT